MTIIILIDNMFLINLETNWIQLGDCDIEPNFSVIYEILVGFSQVVVSWEDGQRCQVDYEILGLIDEHGDYYIGGYMNF